MHDQLFIERWNTQSSLKRSQLCVGLDPLIGEDYLEGENLFQWGKAYLQAVIPFAAALKANSEFWDSSERRPVLIALLKEARLIDPKILFIYDRKIRDIGTSNLAAIQLSLELKPDAITVCPFAGNLITSCAQLNAHNIASIPLVLMSNPEYEKEKNKLVAETLVVPTTNPELDNKEPLIPQYQSLSRQAVASDSAAVVIGASKHLKQQELTAVLNILHPYQLLLVPGMGRQGGNLSAFNRKDLNPQRLMVNVGGSLMYGDKADPSFSLWASQAQKLRNQINELI